MTDRRVVVKMRFSYLLEKIAVYFIAIHVDKREECLTYAMFLSSKTISGVTCTHLHVQVNNGIYLSIYFSG